MKKVFSNECKGLRREVVKECVDLHSPVPAEKLFGVSLTMGLPFACMANVIKKDCAPNSESCLMKIDK
ncbi:MAG: hypothetical protein FWE16_04095 [Firmicutes bacterium]|nr:hypothetical protein [Bacillota bacterium]